MLRLSRRSTSPYPRSWAAGPAACRWVSDAFDDDDLQFARAVLLAVRRGLKVFGRFVAADRLLEARELDDDEAVAFFRTLEDLVLAAARQDLAAEFLRMPGTRSVYFLY